MIENAIIKTGGKQYHIKAGDIIVVESLPTDPGKTQTFDSVLLLQKDSTTTVGTPFVASATVQATVMEHLRDKKVRVFKMRRRKKSRRTQGHRQELTKLRIDSING